MKTIPLILVKTWLEMSYLFGHENKQVRKAASRRLEENFGSKEIAQMYVDQFVDDEYKKAS